jgi:hypothetical protein
MIYYIAKIMVSAGLVVAVSEAAKRSGFIGGLIASLPIVSLLAICWLYADTRDTQKVAALSWSIFWLVIPSLTFFAALGFLIGRKWMFGQSIAVALLVMAAGYGVTVLVLKR